MSKTIKATADIKKIVRSGGKDFAVVTINIPAGNTGDLPLGKVLMTITPVQQEMSFGGNKKAYKDEE